MAAQTFRTTLRAEGKTATGFEVPPEVVEALGSGKKPKVTVTINGYTYRSTVFPYTEAYMLPLAAEHRVPAGVKAGDEIEVSLELDTAPREIEVPPELTAALDADPQAKAFFDGLSYSNKRVFTLNVEGTANPETKARRVEKAIALMREGRVR
jgi:bacteriocin resistance YdeI/OmpD-like protein/uncharacterized protein DUF1905